MKEVTFKIKLDISFYVNIFVFHCVIPPFFYIYIHLFKWSRNIYDTIRLPANTITNKPPSIKAMDYTSWGILLRYTY